MKCPGCGAEAAGRFCSGCGTALGAVKCPECGHEPPAEASFCNQCGAAMGAGALAGGSARRTGPASQAVWYMAGALMVGLILVIAYPVYGPDRGDSPPPPVPPPAAPAGGASSVDLSTMTPRQAADRLFNRVMSAASAGDVAEVTNFLPMAISAHEMVEELDADGKFHLVTLRLQGSMHEDALVTAEEILAEQPDHLLALAGAADASLALGDSASGRAFYQRWLDAYDSEMAKDLSEYRDHSALLPTHRATAQALIGND